MQGNTLHKTSSAASSKFNSWRKKKVPKTDLILMEIHSSESKYEETLINLNKVSLKIID